METLVPGWLSHSTLWMAALLLCLGDGALGGDIDTDHLHTIIQHIQQLKPDKMMAQYAFAVSLGQTYCSNADGLKKVLPKVKLENMYKGISHDGDLYVPEKENLVAARVRYLDETRREHAEWRLLQGGNNSPVQKLLAQTYENNSCLIFFTLNSPCLETCLRKNSRYNILPMVNDTFRLINNNYKAFVFQQIYDKDQGKGQELLQAWSELRGTVPLMRCDNNGCRNYAGDGTSNRRNR